MEAAQTIEGAPALKHGINENPEKEFSALFCIVYLAKQYLKLARTTARKSILMNQTNPHKKGTLALAHFVCFSGDEQTESLIGQGVLITEVYNILIFRPRYLSISALKIGICAIRVICEAPPVLSMRPLHPQITGLSPR